MSQILPVILSGGSGTRLWPSSRAARPKQFVELIGDNSLFELTLERISGLSSYAPVVVCNADHRFLVADQLMGLGIENASILLEPVARNTAAAIALAAFQAEAKGITAPLLVCPSDHLIEDKEAFHAVVREAANEALTGSLVTFGIEPAKPETGYGCLLYTSPSPRD